MEHPRRAKPLLRNDHGNTEHHSRKTCFLTHNRCGAVGVPIHRRLATRRPRLQVPHYDSQGFIGDADFAWEGFGLVGEADGDVKYSDPRLRVGRPPERVVLDEKVREDRIRALPRRVARWRWNIAINPATLRATVRLATEPSGFVRERTAGSFTAKEVRSLRGTIVAATSLAKQGPQATSTARRAATARAMRDVAEVLGNTAAVARKGYVDLRVLTA